MLEEADQGLCKTSQEFASQVSVEKSLVDYHSKRIFCCLVDAR
jgi:hypothetical protein